MERRNEHANARSLNALAARPEPSPLALLLAGVVWGGRPALDQKPGSSESFSAGRGSNVGLGQPASNLWMRHGPPTVFRHQIAHHLENPPGEHACQAGIQPVQ